MTDHGSLPTNIAHRIDTFCLEFEQAWRSKETPRLEEYLHRWGESADYRDQLFEELLRVELEIQTESGLHPTVQQYRVRFPDYVDTIKELFGERAENRDPGESSETVTARPSDTDGVPSLIGRYEVQRIIDSGRFGVVYLAKDPRMDCLVAIKQLKIRDVVSALGEDRSGVPQLIDSLLPEARLAAKLRKHPGIVSILDVLTTSADGRDTEVCFVQEFIEGGNLKNLIHKRPVPPIQTARILHQVAQAVAYVHKNGIYHRDLKPGNILLDTNGNPFITDFGLAVDEKLQMRRKGEIAGTVPYMAPEQTRGEVHLLDGRADIWGLGVIMYEMLTGSRPFRGDTTVDIFADICHREPRPPRILNPQLPAELERICLKCLSKRMTDRYSTASDLAEELGAWVSDAHSDRQPDLQPQREPAPVVPKGLRSFDAEDADFFLELLAGPRDRRGLPYSVRFWQQKIEESDADQTFRVGLLYGPSGCGKSSFLKAGLLPRLDRVLPVYVEATSIDTELRILLQLRKIVPSLSQDLSLPAAMAKLREDPALTAHRKTLLVIDQFEQWLQSRRSFGGEQLIEALRQCDGAHVQVLLLVRDDFWMAITRFLHELEVDLVQGENLAAVDLFDHDHAQKVLTKFGRAYGKIDPNKEPSLEQQEFIRDVVEGISSDGKVVCVRLAVFAEMVKGKQWIPETIAKVGGTTGIGESFLEDAFSGPSANPQHRALEKQARAVLRTLLPEKGSDIKGHRIVRDDLQQRSGCAKEPVAFEQVVRILDTELRLITPTDPDSQRLEETESGPRDDSTHYQLTHDYLIPSLRNWLTRKQRGTAKGRAELLLEERADVWSVQPENRYLPSFGEFFTILLHTSRDPWSTSQKAMLSRASRVYGFWTAIAVLFLAVVGIVGYAGNSAICEHNNTARSEEMVQTVLACSMGELREQISSLEPYRNWCDPLLQSAFHDRNEDSPEKLRAGLALVEVDNTSFDYLFKRLQTADVQDFSIILALLRPVREQLVEQSWKLMDRDATNSGTIDGARRRAAAALAMYDPDNDRWAELGHNIVPSLVRVPLDELGAWKSLYHPVRHKLIDDLDEEFSQREPGNPIRNVAMTLLADYVDDNPDRLAALIARADPSHFSQCIPAVKQHDKTGVKALWNAFDKATKLPSAEPVAPQLERRITTRIDDATGAINGKMAFVQMLPLEDFQQLNDALIDGGYYTVSYRPFSVQGKSHIAACWHRGQRRSVVESGLSAEYFLSADEDAREAGLRISDVSYHTRMESPRDEQTLAAVWVEMADNELETQVYASVSATQHQTSCDELPEAGYVLYRLSTCSGADGLPLFTAAWRRTTGSTEEGSAISRIRYAPRFGDVYPGYLQTDLQVSRFDFSNPDLFDQFVNSNFLSHRAALAVEPPADPPDSNAKFLVAQYQLLFRRYDESIALLDELLESDDNTQKQLARFYQYLARAYFRTGNLAKLKESFASFSQHSKDFTKTLTLQIRVGVLENETVAVEKALDELKAICEKNDSRIARLIALRGYAIAATVADNAASQYRQSALAWLTRLMEGSPKQSDLDKLLSDEDFDSLRAESAFRDLFEHGGFGQRLTAVWAASLEKRSSMIVQLAPDDHLQRAEELLGTGYLPVSIAASETLQDENPKVSSVWHIQLVSSREQNDREIAIANLAAALAWCDKPQAAQSVLSDEFGRSPRAQLIHRLAKTETPTTFLVDCLAEAQTDDLHRSALLALGEYPCGFFASRLNDVAADVREVAEKAERSSERAAAEWCLRVWGLKPAEGQSDSSHRNNGFVNSFGQRMIRIEPRQFLMGSPGWEPFRGDSEQQHWQTIGRRYALAATETTVAQFREFLDDPKVKTCYEDCSAFTFSTRYAALPDCPQISVRWYDAALFCQWLSEKEGIEREQWCFPDIWTSSESDFRLPSDFLKRTGYRLPTEAEWEYACRGGSQGQFPFGSNPELLSEHSWHLLNSLPPDYTTRPVSMTPPNDFGLYDMIGNVNEWCVDAKDAYRTPFDGFLQEDTTDPEDLNPFASERVVRGGSFDSVPGELRCADRKQAESGYKRFSLGFRVARTLPD